MREMELKVAKLTVVENPSKLYFVAQHFKRAFRNRIASRHFFTR